MRSVYTTGIIAAGYNNKTICACPVGFRRDFHCRITDSPSQNRSRFGHFFGNREAVRIRFYIIEGGAYSMASRKSLAGVSSLAKQQTGKGNYMKKLLLIALVVSGLAFVPVPRSGAQVSVGIGGVGIGFGYPRYRYSYYGYPGYGYGYYPYGYYRSYPYYGYYGSSYGHRVYRHHRHHYYRHRY